VQEAVLLRQVVSVRHLEHDPAGPRLGDANAQRAHRRLAGERVVQAFGPAVVGGAPEFDTSPPFLVHAEGWPP
jgi:hypothetical protein